MTTEHEGRKMIEHERARSQHEFRERRRDGDAGQVSERREAKVSTSKGVIVRSECRE